MRSPNSTSRNRPRPRVDAPHGVDVSLEDHDRGFTFDRRWFLSAAAGAGLALIAGCSSSGQPEAAVPEVSDAANDTTGDANGDATGGEAAGANATAELTAGTCEVIPPETAGPFPGDGSNGPDVLTASGVVRSDIRTSIGSASGTAEGVPIQVRLRITDAATGCGTPLPGAAVYIWQCDALGRYSMYSPGAENENYLRGVQVADGDGAVTFTSIVPGAYPGRWPHIHFEVYSDVEAATSAGQPSATSQLALPAELCESVYGGTGYDGSMENLAQMSIETDMVFADSIDQQLAVITGSVGNGLTASLDVAV